jgi:ubiquinone/menaquinone biosynthesis C-methylase UbiE
MKIEISPSLKKAYDEQYSEDMTEWRELGGKYKANNIVRVCTGYKFNRVLECGAGEGGVLKSLDERGVFDELYAIEISESGISQINKRKLPHLKEVKIFNGYEIPFPDGFFEMAYCTHVIEHVEFPRLLLRELKRVSCFQVFEVPLDYSVNVDRKVKARLSYGHINVYTPSLFRYLLKTEGYEIFSERLSHTSKEEIRYGLYFREGVTRSVSSESKLAILPLKHALKRFLWGKRNYNEFAFDAYTCLAKGTGELEIFPVSK